MSQSRLSERLDEMKDEILEGIQKSVQIDSVATEAEENAPYGPGPKAALDFALHLGEELGFRGCVIVIVLFLLIIYECLLIAARAKDLSGRLLCAGMATLIAFQAFANIAVATGIFPNTGLPLPFISYGSSSLISIFIGMGLVLNVGLQRETRHF